MMKWHWYSCLILCLLFAFAGCREKYTPKPREYFRIGFPPKEYKLFSGDYPYSFDIPAYATISQYAGKWSHTDTANYWVNIEFPQFRSRLYLTYKVVENNLAKLIEEAHAFAYKHSVVADAIAQQEYLNPESNVYGVLFDIKGNTASSYQFYMTDSANNFLRGALYTDTEPNKDSIAPVNEFLRKDIERLIETIRWKPKS